MKISGHDVSRTAAEARAARESSPDRPTEGGEATRSAAGPASEVRVSATSRALVAPETPDLERVARLRDEIASGSFRVDAERIAERMLEEER